jgi:hypothetical protein
MRYVYFDTSIINRLFNDSNNNAITEKILENFHVRLSVFNICEISAESDINRRSNLISFSQKLLNGFRPLDMTHDLLKRSLIAYKNEDQEFTCTIEEDKSYIWDLLCESPLNSEAYDDLIKIKDYSEKWYQTMHNNGRDEMQEILKSMPTEERDRLQSSEDSFFKEMCNKRKDHIVDFIVNYVEANIPEVQNISKEEALFIFENVGPWRFFPLGMAHGIYKRSIQQINYSKKKDKKNPGYIDTQQAVYLPFNDIFVTNDGEQYNMLRLLSKFDLSQKRKIMKFDEFKERVYDNK